MDWFLHDRDLRHERVKLDSLTPKLDEYAYQYNSGVHQGLFRLSPFEVFFGRKANENAEYIQNIGELYTPSGSKKIICNSEGNGQELEE